MDDDEGAHSGGEGVYLGEDDDADASDGEGGQDEAALGADLAEHGHKEGADEAADAGAGEEEAELVAFVGLLAEHLDGVDGHKGHGGGHHGEGGDEGDEDDGEGGAVAGDVGEAFAEVVEDGDVAGGAFSGGVLGAEGEDEGHNADVEEGLEEEG